MVTKLSRHEIEAARQILTHPVVKEIFDGMEMDAINSAVSAKMTDTETQQSHLAHVRVIRAFRSRLDAILADSTATVERIEAAK